LRAMEALEVFRGRKGILFDLDGTLYCSTANADYFREVDRITGLRVQRYYGTHTPEEAFARLERDQERLGYRSKSESLERLFGIGLAEMNRWRERLTEPERYIAQDDRLREVLRDLAARFVLVLGTNNAPRLTRRILEVLGVPASSFRSILTSEDVGAAKPEHGFFLQAAAAAGLAPREMVSVGDRSPSDLEPAVALGMGAYRVRSIDDVYALAGATP